MILVIDTSLCGIAIGAVSVDTGEIVHKYISPNPRTAESELATQVAKIRDTGTMKRIVVSRGPGSFTGIRIGLAFVQGLARNDPRRVCGVSSLQALANLFSTMHDEPCNLFLPLTANYGLIARSELPSSASLPLADSLPLSRSETNTTELIPLDLQTGTPELPSGRNFLCKPWTKLTTLHDFVHQTLVPTDLLEHALEALARAGQKKMEGEPTDFPEPLYARPPYVNAP